MAFTVAKKGIELNYSNPKLWNEYFNTFYSYATHDASQNPFLGENEAF